MHEVEVWGPNGGGGYYTLLLDDKGHMSLPAGRQAWERFARYAPEELIHQAVAAATACRDARRKAQR